MQFPHAHRRIPLAVGSALLVCAAALPAFAAGADDARRMQRIAETDNIEIRRDICFEMLASKPAGWARDFCEGFEALLAGRDHEVDRALNSALSSRPDFSIAALIYGETYESLGRLDRAEASYRRAIDAQPRRTDARFALGALLFRRGRDEDPRHLPQALEAFRQMAETDPTAADGWSNMGLVLVHMNRFRDAEEVMLRAIMRNPNDPLLYDNLGALYAREDRAEEAEEQWKRALSINPGYGPAVVELAALYARSGQLARAIDVLEAGRHAIQAPPWGTRIRRNLGFAYLGLEAPDMARDRFTQATMTGGDALGFLGLGHLRMIEGDTRAALSAFDRGAALDSTLARPFIRAWRATLKFAHDPAQHPHLASAIRASESESAGWADDFETTPSSVSGISALSGPRATPALVEFVLGDWSFGDADVVRERLARADSAPGGYDTPPVPIHTVAAEYSESAQDRGLRGLVQVLVVVDEQGHVADARIQKCDAPLLLCDSALRAARQWVFEPAMRYGTPVRASVVLPFRFTQSRE